MNLTRYLLKLRHMSGDEIAFRLRQVVRNRGEQFRLRRNGSEHDPFVPARVRDWPVAERPFPGADVRFFGLESKPARLRDTFEARFGERMAMVRRQADDRLAHRFHLLGLDVTLPERIDWNANPDTGAVYPLDHHAAMDTFNTERYGDVKFVWELNRHQFFIEVAKAYYLTGEARYADKLGEWLDTWIADSPYKRGINHTSVLEHAVRIFAWIWARYFTRDAAVWTPERTDALVRQLLLHGEITEENLSHYFSPYNHLIGELAALAFLGTVYPADERLRRWRDDCWAQMEAQVDFQFHPDGFTVEQASYYHHFTLGFYLQVAILRRQNGLPVSERVWARLEKATEFAMYLTRPDGKLPRYGDIDNARSVYFCLPEPMWDLRCFQALGAVLFERPDMKAVAGSNAEEVLWLLGPKGVETFESLSSHPPNPASRHFPASGYSILRDSWRGDASYCSFDCGEIAHGVHDDETPSAAHGHGDILAVEVCVQGTPLFVDPGFHTYFGDLDWHRYLRDSRGHNVITVDGCGQGVHQGRLGWSNVSRPRHEIWVDGPDGMVSGGSINRFAGLDAPAIHRRWVAMIPERWLLILDEVVGDTGDREFSVVSSFHATGVLTVDGATLVHDGNPVGVMALPEGAAATVACGGDGVDQGWGGDGYGYKEAAPVLRIAVTAPLPVRMAMLLPIGANAGRMPAIVAEAGADATWRIDWGGGEVERVVWTPLDEMGLVVENHHGTKSQRTKTQSTAFKKG